MKKLSVRQQANRIEKILLKATDNEKTEGKAWYKDAHDFARRVALEYGLTVAQVSQLISLLSPQKKWEQNKADVISVLDGNTDSIFSTKRTLNECMMVIEGTFEIPSNRMKTFAFAKCIEEAYDESSDAVVIDRHAIKIAYGQMSATAIAITDFRYREAAKAYKKVGEKYNIPAHQVQAITWVAYKRIVNR